MDAVDFGSSYSLLYNRRDPNEEEIDKQLYQECLEFII